jgi:hypothetical protein
MVKITTSETALDLKLVNILRHHEIALSILKEYPRGFENIQEALSVSSRQ